MIKQKRCLLYYTLILLLVMTTQTYSAVITFDWIRLLKEHPNPGPGWDPRVSVTGEVVYKTLGSELITDSTFSSAKGIHWDYQGTAWTFYGGSIGAQHTGSSTEHLHSVNNLTTLNKVYKIIYEVKNLSFGGVYAALGHIDGEIRTSNGVYLEYIIAPGTCKLEFHPDSAGFYGSIVNVSMKEVTYNKPYTDYLHWAKESDSDFSEIDFCYDMNIPSNIWDYVGYDNTVKASFAAWTNIPSAKIHFNFDSSLLLDPPWAVDDKNVVSFSFYGEIDGFDGPQEVIGKTLLSWDNATNELFDCDVVLNASELHSGGTYTWSLDTMDYSTKTIDIQSVLTHEIGHILGIAHPYSSGPPSGSEIDNDTCPTMFASLQPAFFANLKMRTLAQYDKNCASYLYPPTSDGNDTYDSAEPITPGNHIDLSITPNDKDWYAIFLQQYDTLKVVIDIPSGDLDMYICKDPAESGGTPVDDIDVVPNAQLRWKSDRYNYSTHYENVYCHTVNQEGDYYILVKGKGSTDQANYEMDLWVSQDGDGAETADNRTSPIPDGDGMDDTWEITNGLDPTDITDGDTDDDCDGLANVDEFVNDTNPADNDTDDDTMPDGWEVGNELDPLTDDSAQDPDNDGKTNLEEYKAGTNPKNPASVFKLGGFETDTELNKSIIKWNSEPTQFYEVLYTNDIAVSFQLMEEFLPGNEYELGVEASEYHDKGYPFPESPDPGTIRSAPMDNDSRYYKVKIK